MKEEYKSLVGMDIQKWAKSPVMSDGVRPYPLEKEQVTLVFSDGSNVTVSEKEDESGELVWEWSEKRVPFSCRPRDGVQRVMILEDVEKSYLEVLSLSTEETVLIVSKDEVSFDEEMFEKTARIMEKRPVWIFAGDSALGKSTLGRFLELQGKIVYETDSDQRLPHVIMADVIVAGNRNKSLTIEDTAQDYLKGWSQSSLSFLWLVNICRRIRDEGGLRARSDIGYVFKALNEGLFYVFLFAM